MNQNPPATTALAVTVYQVRPLLIEAHGIYGQILATEHDLQQNFLRLYEQSWQFGSVLTRIKDQIGHGKWLFFLGANWPDLGIRTAQRSMLFFAENPKKDANASVPTHFNVDSVRKLLGGYVPAKERPELPGDESVPQLQHHLTCVKDLATWTHRLDVGLIKKPEIDALRRDFEQPLRKLIEVLGRDWIETLLA